jgi:NADPH-dependent F420 reductase
MTTPERDPNDTAQEAEETTPEPVADEPAADEPVAEEPVADERTADEPTADEPVPDEPVVEEVEEVPPDPTEPNGERRDRQRRSRREQEAATAEDDQLRIAFIGGTGPEGLGLAMRFARAGNMVYIGSRTEERANEAIAKVKELVPNGDVFGGLNREGAERADVVFVTVPSDAHEATLTELADAIGDKVLVDVVVPMVFDKDGPRAVDLEDGSAAEAARRIAPEAKVISAFHHLDGGQLQKVDRPMQGDVLVCGDHKAAKKQVMDLVEQIEWVRALDAGPLSNSRYLENWTVVLIHLNKIYKAHSGVRITGI